MVRQWKPLTQSTCWRSLHGCRVGSLRGPSSLNTDNCLGLGAGRRGAAKEGTKSLSEKFSSPKSNPGTSEMNEGEIVLGLLVPTGQETTKTIHPGMGSFDHPA